MRSHPEFSEWIGYDLDMSSLMVFNPNITRGYRLADGKPATIDNLYNEHLVQIHYATLDEGLPSLHFVEIIWRDDQKVTETITIESGPLFDKAR